MDNSNFQTREKECEIMVSMIPPRCKNVLEPTPGKGNLVRAIKSKGFSVIEPYDFWVIVNTEIKFDAICMNPPFTPMSEGYKILFACMDMSDNIIALMPWLTIINSERRTRAITSFGLKSVTHLPRNAFKGSRVQTCILNMQKNHKGKCCLHFSA